MTKEIENIKKIIEEYCSKIEIDDDLIEDISKEIIAKGEIILFLENILKFGEAFIRTIQTILTTKKEGKHGKHHRTNTAG